MDFKGTPNNGKDLLTSRKDPWAESQDLKRPVIEKSISKDLKGPKRTLGTFMLKNTPSPRTVRKKENPKKTSLK